MFYRMYLSSVCNRRSWPEPMYEPTRDRFGYRCKVRVNNREYSTDVPYETEDLARDNAAMKAFMICRNFSANDGRFPGQRPGQKSANGVVQGLPVAIGTGRRSNRSSTSSSEGTPSPGNSPKSAESLLEPGIRETRQDLPKSGSRRGHHVDEYMCYCGRAPAHRHYGRCGWCLNESRWAS